MTQTKTSKRALLTSALSLLLCCTMLIGTTWAWFTDSVTSAGNKIQSGTLQVDLLVKGGNTDYPEYTSVKTDHKPIFNYDLWEPGYTLVTNAKVVNNGTLALKYTLKFVSEDDIASQKLAEVIDVFYASSEVSGIDSRTALNDKIADKTLKPLGTLKDVFTQGEAVVMNDNLEPKGKENCEDFATIVLKMKEEAGNEYQNQTISAFDIQLLATQWTYENDTFDDQYDVNATYPVVAVANVTDATAPLSISVDNVTVTVPADTAVAGDKFELVIDSKNVSTDENGNTIVVCNITLKKNGTAVTSGDVDYTVEMNIGSGAYIYYVKHNGSDVLPFNYDSATGILSFTTKSFSPFEVKYVITKTTVNGQEYETVAEALTEAQSGDTVALTAGEFELGQSQTIGEGVSIEGTDKDETVIKIKAKDGDGYKVTNEDVTISNVTFDGTEITSGGHHSLINVQKDGMVIDNCNFVGGGQATWNSSIYVTNLATGTSFTVKNSNITGSFRGILRESCGADIIVDNCEIDAVYPININGGSKPSCVKVSNSKFHGWTSYSSITKATFTNTEFSKGKSGYNNIAAYEDTELINCTFSSDFKLYAQTSGFTWTINDCTKGGVSVTAENFKELFPDNPDVWNKTVCMVNDVQVTPDA